jgi:hypothetical protein
MSRFHDFTSYSNYGNSASRAETLRIASTIDLDAIDVDVFFGPIGSCGFRSGTWTARYDGETWRFFSSVPHSSDLDTQRARLQHDAALSIAGIWANRTRAAGEG